MSGHQICVWVLTCVGTNVSEHKRVWHKRVWAQTCLGINVFGLKRVWAQTCFGMSMYGHKRVVSVGQSGCTTGWIVNGPL